MIVLFCEYVVAESSRETLLRWAGENLALWTGVEWLENDGQPGVFVEISRFASEEEAFRAQEERLDGRSEWRRMDEWVKGGRQGLRLWLFRPVTARE